MLETSGFKDLSENKNEESKRLQEFIFENDGMPSILAYQSSPLFSPKLTRSQVFAACIYCQSIAQSSIEETCNISSVSVVGFLNRIKPINMAIITNKDVEKYVSEYNNKQLSYFSSTKQDYTKLFNYKTLKDRINRISMHSSNYSWDSLPEKEKEEFIKWLDKLRDENPKECNNFLTSVPKFKNKEVEERIANKLLLVTYLTNQLLSKVENKSSREALSCKENWVFAASHENVTIKKLDRDIIDKQLELIGKIQDFIFINENKDLSNNAKDNLINIIKQNYNECNNDVWSKKDLIEKEIPLQEQLISRASEFNVNVQGVLSNISSGEILANLIKSKVENNSYEDILTNLKESNKSACQLVNSAILNYLLNLKEGAQVSESNAKYIPKIIEDKLVELKQLNEDNPEDCFNELNKIDEGIKNFSDAGILAYAIVDVQSFKAIKLCLEIIIENIERFNGISLKDKIFKEDVEKINRMVSYPSHANGVESKSKIELINFKLSEILLIRKRCKRINDIVKIFEDNSERITTIASSIPEDDKLALVNLNSINVYGCKSKLNADMLTQNEAQINKLSLDDNQKDILKLLNKRDPYYFEKENVIAEFSEVLKKASFDSLETLKNVIERQNEVQEGFDLPIRYYDIITGDLILQLRDLKMPIDDYINLLSTVEPNINSIFTEYCKSDDIKAKDDIKLSLNRPGVITDLWRNIDHIFLGQQLMNFSDLLDPSLEITQALHQGLVQDVTHFSSFLRDKMSEIYKLNPPPPSTLIQKIKYIKDKDKDKDVIQVSMNYVFFTLSGARKEYLFKRDFTLAEKGEIYTDTDGGKYVKVNKGMLTVK